MRYVSKQGRGNTDKPACFVDMLKEVLDFFDAHGVGFRKYPITFDSWYGSRQLIDILREFGFETILGHAKDNYVMMIGEEKTKLSEHKKSIQLHPDQWGCGDTPVCRTTGSSRAFGDVVLLFFRDGRKGRTMMVFGKPLRACEILRIWFQHHGIEQYWQNTRVVARFENRLETFTNEFRRTTRGLCELRCKSDQLSLDATGEPFQAKNFSSRTT